MRNRASVCAICVGLLLSAPFAFYPKLEAIGALGFLLTVFGLALCGSLRRVTRVIAITHLVAFTAAIILFLYHGADLLYIKFLLSLIISFQFCIADKKILFKIRNGTVFYGARGAALAILSFGAFFAFGFSPFYRTLLGDGRSIPFFGLTNINFGFGSPEILIFGRPAFLFDEPGQFAHFIVLLLAIIATAGPAAMRWVRETRLLVFSGFATFSLAFLVLAGIYLSTKILKVRTWILIAVIAAGVYAISDNPLFVALQYRLGSHEADIDDRAVSGDNRSREVAMALEAFSENVVMGAGWSEADRRIGHFAASIVGPLGYSGLMAILLYLPLLERLYRCFAASRNGHTLLVVALVALFFSQRPYFYFPLFIFLMEVLRRQIIHSPISIRRRKPNRRPQQRIARSPLPRLHTDNDVRPQDR